ncbi:MAG: HAMP domain-containing sensor histidine kinase [Acidimicrobiia bacterium]
MFRLSARAPISYDEMRGPYNMLRIAGAFAFICAGVVGAVALKSPAPLLLAATGTVTAADALIRLRTRASVFGGFVVDTTAFFVLLAGRGAPPATCAIVVLYLIVAASLILPMGYAALVVGYATVLWVVAATLEDLGVGGPVGLLERAGFTVAFDRTVIVVFTLSVAIAMLGAMSALLRAQDQQAEALAQERRAAQLKNEFVSMVSHELRTPLTGIAGFTDTLGENWETLPSREVDEFLAIMRKETDHLANLVEDILVIPRLEAGQLRLDPVAVDLATETHSVAELLFGSQRDYAVSIPAGVTVLADRTRLHQILRNLLENARKYGGDQILIEGELAGPGVYRIAVSDNGGGVAPEDRDRIFEHFEQLSKGDGRMEQGVGLGLPIARTLTRAMGGDLWYEDRFPVGARFCFSVPLADAAAPRTTDTEVDDLAPTSS